VVVVVAVEEDCSTAHLLLVAARAVAALEGLAQRLQQLER
jgi:hypothetical protein